MAKPQQKRARAARSRRRRSRRSSRRSAAKRPAEGPLALDRLIHERLRLGIVSALAVNESLTFNDLKKLNADDRRQSERPRAEARGSQLHHVHQVVRGPGAEDASIRSRRSGRVRSSGTSTTWKP